MALSSGLTLTDLSDYLAPSQACIKPVTYIPDEDLTATKLDKPAAAGSAEIIIGEDEAFYERRADGERGQKLKKAEITLNDCLACSGCITTAESMLVSLQSHEEVYRVLAEQPGLVPILSISPQSVASLAALYDLSLEETMRGLRRFFKEELGFRLVFDTTFARSLSLLETRLEHLERRAFSQASPIAAALPAHLTASTSILPAPTKLTPSSSSTAPLPILSSACPGWICYAEKTHGDLLPFVSGVKSPQAVAGVLVKGAIVAGKLGLRPDEIYHVAVMPCYDKKLEASRPDFATSHPPPPSADLEAAAPPAEVSVRDVDLVLTTGEVAKMLSDKGLPLRNLALSPSPTPDEAEEATYIPFSRLLQPPTGTSSGSYVHAAITSLLSSSVPSSPSHPPPPSGSLALSPSDLPLLRLDSKVVRNDDYVEYTLRLAPSPSSTGKEGKTLARFAKCYGFRNLQNVVRKLGKDAGVSTTRGAAGKAPASAAAAAANARRLAKMGGGGGGGVKEKEPEIELIEVMACPSGCVNGGGQIAPPKEALAKRRRRNSWTGTGAKEFVGRVDEEGMPDVVVEQVRDEVLEVELKAVAVAGVEGDEKVLSSKEWVAEVEKRYWSACSPAFAADTSSSSRGVDFSTLHPSIHPYLSSLPSLAEEEALRRVVEELVGEGEGAEERRKELLRTSYRAVESEEVNGLAVVW